MPEGRSASDDSCNHLASREKRRGKTAAEEMRHFDFSRCVCWGDNETPSRDAAYKQLIGHRFTFIKKALHALFAHMGCEGKSTPEGLALLDEIFNGNPPCAKKPSAAELAQAATSVVSWFYSMKYTAFCDYYASTVPVD